MNPRSVLVVLSLFLISAPLVRADLRSPDHRTRVEFRVQDGSFQYRVQQEDTPMVTWSSVGVSFLNRADLTGPFEVETIRYRSGTDEWTPVWGETDHVRKKYNEAVVTLQDRTEGGKRHLELRFRVYNDGVAFRYRLPAENGEKPFKITSERTQFRLPENDTAFALKREGYDTNYEGPYDSVSLQEIDPDTIVGLPLLIQRSDRWVAITEANLEDYAGMYVTGQPEEETGLVSSLAPHKGQEKIKVSGTYPHETPWRVLLIGDHPGELLNASPLVPLLNEPSQLKETDWIRPGQISWVWWNGRVVEDEDIEGGRPSTAVMKHYIDFAARHDVPGVLVDAGWYSKEGDAWDQPREESVFTMEESRTEFYDIWEVIDYAHKRGVDVHIWVHLQSVLGNLDRIFRTFSKWGVQGVKVDSHGGDSQGMVEAVHQVARTAAKYDLMVNYHGAYKPTGLRRTYPNFMTREGVMGLEYGKWSNKPQPQHNVTIPFTRMLAGPMDYTPGAFDLNGGEGDINVQTTRAHQITLYILYFSPQQMLVDYPAVYEENLDQFQFVRSIPTSWDETVPVAAKPGDVAAIARRHGETWFLGAATDEEKRTLEITLDFLPQDRTFSARILKDGENVEENPEQVTIEEQQVRHGNTLTVDLPAAGGYAVRFDPQK